jgi:hypothetical protein
MRWPDHVACAGERRGFWGGSLMERNHLEDLGVDEDILKLILNK